MMNTFKIIIAIFVFQAASANAANWYFDKDSIGGTCNNSGAGTITEPFCSILTKTSAAWNGPAAGDTIYIRAGNYTGNQFDLRSGGFTNATALNPIYIRPYPGETVTFTAATDSDLWINNRVGDHHGLHFIGPFTLSGYSQALDGWAANPLADGWRFENITITSGSSGFYARHLTNTTFKNITCSNLRGGLTRHDDHAMCVGVRGDVGLVPDNIVIEDIVAHDINDGNGNDNGDADGVWTGEYVDTVLIKNVQAYRCSEDGVDTKAMNVTMENITAYHNGASGVKLWGSTIETPTGTTYTYSVKNVLTYGNSETGIKCTGNGDNVIAVVDHLTAWGNGEDNVKNGTGIDASDGCNLTVRNSIIGQAGLQSVLVGTPRDTYETSTIFSHTNITHSGSSPAINIVGCSPLSGKYTTTQYSDGTYNTEMAATVDCGGVYGVVGGGAISPTSSDPALTDPTPVFEWASMAEDEITSNSVLLATEASYPWPSPTVGHYIEINDDGIMREITAIGDSTTRTITFTPAVSLTVVGRLTDGRGTRIIGWESQTTNADAYTLTQGSTLINAGLYVEGVHCPTAGATGDCITWYGSAPDLGYYEYPGRTKASISNSGTIFSSRATGTPISILE